MAIEPFSTGADQSGTADMGGYAAGTGPATSSTGATNPAFGRSSRDLASDSGPAAAPQGLWSSTLDTDTKAGADADAPTRPNRQPHNKTNPDVDPDTRLGLHPATTRTVAPQLPTFPVTGTKSRAATGAVAGLIGAALVVALAYVLRWANLIPAPPSLAAADRLLTPRGASGLAMYVAGGIGSVIMGAAWGAAFGLFVRRPTILKGMLFGLLPTLLQWLILSPLTGQGLFFNRTAAGFTLPLLFNVLIFGTAIGYYCGRLLRPPYTGAVDPDLTSAVPNP